MDAIWFGQVSVSVFFVIVFLQSGLDKFIDREGNLAYITGFFRELKIITYPTPCEQGDYPQTIFPNPIGAQSVFQSCSWLLA